MKILYGRTGRFLKKQRPTVFNATVGPAHTLNMVGKPWKGLKMMVAKVTIKYESPTPYPWLFL